LLLVVAIARQYTLTLWGTATAAARLVNGPDWESSESTFDALSLEGKAGQAGKILREETTIAREADATPLAALSIAPASRVQACAGTTFCALPNPFLPLVPGTHHPTLSLLLPLLLLLRGRGAYWAPRALHGAHTSLVQHGPAADGTFEWLVDVHDALVGESSPSVLVPPPLTLRLAMTSVSAAPAVSS
jgi:hypothetical protein